MPVKLGCKNILDNVDMQFVLDNVNVDNTPYAVSHDALCQQT